MKDTLISPKTARLANKKGFRWKTMYHYSGGRVINVAGYPTSENSYKTNTVIDAPTQSFLQKYLREKHDIWCSMNERQEFFIIDFFFIDRVKHFTIFELRLKRSFNFKNFSFMEYLQASNKKNRKSPIFNS